MTDDPLRITDERGEPAPVAFGFVIC